MTDLSSLFRRITALVAATAISVLSPLGRANEYQETAEEAVAASRAQATAAGQELVRKDFGKTLDLIFAQLSAFARSKDLVHVLVDLNRELERSFASLKVGDEQRRLVTLEALNAFERRYEDAVRLRFQTSWIPIIQDQEYEKARRMISVVIEDARNRCAAGASLRQGSFLPVKSLVAPPYVSRFQIKPQLRPLDVLSGGSPISISYGFTSATGGSAAANRDRANAVSTATSVSNFANAFVVKNAVIAGYNAVVPSSWAAGTAGGALSNAMVAAAPYLAAVALLTIVVMDITARAEATRLNNQIQNALDYQYRHSADHEFVNKAYRETCASMVDAIARIGDGMDALEGPGRSNALKAAHELEPQIQAWNQASVEEEERSCRVDLHTYYSKLGCTVIEAGAKPAHRRPVPDDPTSNCLIDKGRNEIVALDESCRVPYADDAREAMVESLQSARATYAKTYTPAHISQLMQALVTLAFEDQDAVRHQLWSNNVRHLDDEQKQSFRELLLYLGIVRKAQQATAVPLPLTLALAIRRNVDALRAEFVRLTERTVDVIFGRAPLAPLQAELTKLARRTTDLNDSHPGVREISDLRSAIHYTLQELKGLSR